MPEGKVDVNTAKEAILKEIIEKVASNHPSYIKDLAISYRLVAGGPQPGSGIVEPK